MRPNCPYENCYCRAGKNGFCLKHKEIGEAVEALLLLSKGVKKIKTCNNVSPVTIATYSTIGLLLLVCGGIMPRVDYRIKRNLGSNGRKNN